MDGVNEKSAALFVSFLPNMSDRSVVSLRNEFIDVDAAGFWMLSVGGDEEMPSPPALLERSSLFVLVGSISKLRSSIGTTRSLAGDPGTPVLRSISILLTVFDTDVGVVG